MASGSAARADEDDPLHPEGAVRDVVKWAHEAQAARVQSWLRRQSPPPVCTAPAVDRNALPDEVKYHEMDDPKVWARLLAALEPVLKLVGCSNARGITLYQGPTLYAFNPGGGHIAISPGEVYSADPPQDERILHELAEMRIFLAREVFRQMIPIGEPVSGLNEADMRLRLELKLNYLAALTSLEVDGDAAILDGAALDVALFGKPFKVAAGTRGAPTLQQVKDTFGAAKLDYKQ